MVLYYKGSGGSWEDTIFCFSNEILPFFYSKWLSTYLDDFFVENVVMYLNQSLNECIFSTFVEVLLVLSIIYYNFQIINASPAATIITEYIYYH